jgi:LysM repeat protein
MQPAPGGRHIPFAPMRSRLLAASVAVAGLTVVGAAACSDEDTADPNLTLPPILTTTSTTTIPPSTTRPQRFYEIQEGDTLTEIADRFGVPILQLMRLNAIRDQNAIYAGQLIEIPIRARRGSSPETTESP